MLPSFANETVVRIRPGVITSRGSDIPDWENAEEMEIPGCIVQPASTSLSQDGRVMGTSEGLNCYFPPGTDIQPADRISYEGKTYIIAGELKVWKSPTGAVSNMQATLERWKG